MDDKHPPAATEPSPPDRKRSRVGRTMLVAAEAARRNADEIVKAGELVAIRPANGHSLSLAARRVLNLMIQRAAGDAWTGDLFSISKRQLRRGHSSTDQLNATLDEIHDTKVIIECITPAGTPGILTVSILDRRIQETDSAKSSGMHWFRFHEEVTKVLKRSETYALLSSSEMLAFKSKYSLVLYEVGSHLFRRDNPTQILTVEKLREVIGVEQGKMKLWGDLRRFALVQAKREIDHLAAFTFDFEEILEGRRVAKVKLIFRAKAGDLAIAAAEEAARHSTGREARRRGIVEEVVAPSPAVAAPAAVVRDDFPAGAISYSEPWRSIAREHGGGWDINEIAAEFRKSGAADRLKGKKLEIVFLSFCQKWAENRRKA